jgi:hypothetical protein
MANATYSTGLYVNFGTAALILDIYETVNIAANTSNIRGVLTLAHYGSGSPFNNNASSASMSIGGSSWGWSGGYNLPGNSSMTLIDQTVTVGHNANGSGSVGVSGAFDGNGNFPIGDGSVSGTYTMFDIDRSAGAPSSCVATVSGGVFTVAIGAATSYITPFNYYVSYASSSNGGVTYGSWSSERTVASTTSPLATTYSGLTPGLTYKFRVRAYNGVDNYSGYVESAPVFLVAGGKRFDAGANNWALTATAAKRWNGSSFVNLTTLKRFDGTNWVNLS